MKVIIPATNNNANLNSTPARVFGSAESYIIYDIDENTFNLIKNDFYGAKNFNIAKDLMSLEITDIITGKICLACYKNLKKAGIEVWDDEDSITVRETIQKFLLGGTFLMKEPLGFHMHPETHETQIEEKNKILI